MTIIIKTKIKKKNGLDRVIDARLVEAHAVPTNKLISEDVDHPVA